MATCWNQTRDSVDGLGRTCAEDVRIIGDLWATATFKGWKAGVDIGWGDGPDGAKLHGHFQIVLHSGEMGRNYRDEKFAFYGSINDAEKGTKTMTPQETREAIECILSDALSGFEAFDDFCDSLGYDTDSRKAEGTWKACQKSRDKVMRLTGMGEDQLCDLANALRDD